MDSLTTGTRAASLSELWASLRRPEMPKTAGDLRMRLCYSAHDVRIFGAVAGDQMDAAIVVEIAAELLPRNIGAIGGARLGLAAAELPGLPPGRGAVIVQLLDEQFEDLFEQLGTCLVKELRSTDDAGQAVRAVVRQIERWRRFLEKRRELLSPEEVRGLIGELAVLERLIYRIGASEALLSWKSPSGAIRDFECPDVAIEVKSFAASSGATVRVNDPLQLEPESAVPLLLACVELSRTQQPAFTLPDHILRVSQLLCNDNVLVETFENALALAGYLAAHAERYVDGMAVGATYALRIVDDFPRLRPADIPAHVCDVQFSLQLLSLMRFAVDAEAAIGKISQGEQT